jgi:hypothetical protein
VTLLDFSIGIISGLVASVSDSVGASISRGKSANAHGLCKWDASANFSLWQDVLEQCGRSHGLQDVRQAIQDVKSAGVSNWSLDLISGLPGTNLAAWEASLKEALAAAPTHISIYDLQARPLSASNMAWTPISERHTLKSA